MNILFIILVFCVSILLLGNIKESKLSSKIPKEKPLGYVSAAQYNFDTSSVYGVYLN